MITARLRARALGGFGARGLAAAAAAAGDVVGQAIAYARAHRREAYDQAQDVLASALAGHPTGTAAGRLQLAAAELHLDRADFPEVARLCRLAAASASECGAAAPSAAAAEVELAAAALGARAALARGRDAEAFTSAMQCMEVARKALPRDGGAGAAAARRRALAVAAAAAGAVQHAAGEFEAAADSFGQALAAADAGGDAGAGASGDESGSESDGEGGSEKGNPADADAAVALALKQAGAFRLAQGRADEADALAARAVAGAADALATAEADAGGGLTSPALAGEVLADALLLRGQVAMERREWAAAEAALAEALRAAEALGGAGRAALPLLLLAGAYARSGRATLAEGLHREVAKLLGLAPLPAPAAAAAQGEGGAGAAALAEAPRVEGAHASVGALAAWRHAQLLAALPKRGAEAAGWLRAARALHDDAPLGGVAAAPETHLGAPEALAGRGEPGRGVVLDLTARRVLPRAADDALVPPPPPPQ
jgi:hypothetical protein